MSKEVHKHNIHKGPRQHFLNKKKFDPDRYNPKNISKPDVIRNCCERCVQCILWKVDYGKYKKLRDFAQCHKCRLRNIELAYQKLCQECSESSALCAKCEKHYVAPQSEEEESCLDESEAIFASLKECSAEHGGGGALLPGESCEIPSRPVLFDNTLTNDQKVSDDHDVIL
ncbi:hypothetical protein XU18_3690 [Perkinsela sp. CCAP 1560/4]|nr:hypothetical protein XU18_3690 [Perkinsela sp. CCAP 1560/4]|eukprot:KNH05286.1 hypothetical protein XU18_3690 [Perkinsela sp. CCAP 1560/4]